MKLTKKNFGLILLMVLTLSLIPSNTITAEASYSYRIQIMLGGTIPEDGIGSKNHETNVEGMYFDPSAISGAKLSDDGQVLLIDNLSYGQEITFSLQSLVKKCTLHDDDPTNADSDNDGCCDKCGTPISIEDRTTSYYAKGLRISGGDEINTASTITLTVTGDENYVVAYGVGKTVSYKVEYRDAETGELMSQVSDDIYYGAVGEVVYVPARHIDGWQPDSLFKTNSAGLLNHDENHPDGTVFTFKYTKLKDTTVSGEDNVTYQSSTSYGDTTYEYQYRNNGTTTTNGGTTNNRPANGGNGGAGNADANAADGDNANGDNGNGNGEGDGTTIADEETPLDIIDIDDEETAKHGETRKDKLVRKMIICILIAVIAVVSILVALLIAYKKRKGVVAKVEEKKDTKE